jgi:hypothetical protein
MTEPKSKRKPCKNCGKDFNQTRPLQAVCSWRCGYERTMKLKEKKQALESSELAKTKDNLKTKSETLVLQTLINKIVRKIDSGWDCISCDNLMSFSKGYRTRVGVINAGHYVSVGSNCSLRFNLWNIHAQCINCNKDKWGNGAMYYKGLRKRFGADITDYINDLSTEYPSIDLTNVERKEAIIEAKKILIELELLEIKLTVDELTLHRKKINARLNIYK